MPFGTTLVHSLPAYVFVLSLRLSLNQCPPSVRLLLLAVDTTARDDHICWATQELRRQSQALDAACRALEVSTWLSWHI